MAIYSIIWKQSQSDHETTRQERKQDNNKGFLLNADLALFFIFLFQILYPVLSRRLTSKPFALLGLVNLPWKLETMTILLPAPTFSNLSPPAFLRTHIPAHKCLHFYIFQPVRLTKFITARSRVRKAVGRKESLQTFNKLICLFRTCKHPPPFGSSVKKYA